MTSSIDVIQAENEQLRRQLADALKREAAAVDQQTALAHILGVIASSRADLQPVLDAVAESASRLCDATDVAVTLAEGDLLRQRAHVGPIPFNPTPFPLAGSVIGEAMIRRGTVHVHDIASEAAALPVSRARAGLSGWRTALAAPLLREDSALGGILLRRAEVRPFSDAQIALLEAFASQAMIAIENTRLFQELEDRNKELDLALEQRTATGEVLRVIASSPTDLNRVLQTVAENAARLCGGVHANVRRVDGNVLRLAASFGEGSTIDTAVSIAPDTINGRAVLERRTIHIEDFANQDDFVRPTLLEWGLRTIVTTPLLSEGAAVGSISILRREVQPFTDAQIALLETFADQAVIAIENARLFQELENRNGELTEALERESEALEQQTAMSEVLRVIASSPTDLDAVLYTVAENAARLCDANDVVIRRVNGDRLRLASHYGAEEIATEDLPIDRRGSPGGRAVVERRTVHIPDMLAEPDGEFLDALIPRGRQSQGLLPIRTVLVTPLLSQGVAIGAIHLRRLEVNPFTDQQIALLETFADQAVIAIENARLFQELEDRNKELDTALEQQTATGEVLRVIASSPTDLQTVLDTVAENAARLCGAANATIRRADGEFLRNVAKYGPSPSNPALPLVPTSANWRAFLERRTIHIHDFANQDEFVAPPVSEWGLRTALITPLMREGTPIGTLMIRRQEVQPFTDAQIALLETFADQAVIAIENTRLFQELEDRNMDLAESLEQQTATSEVLRVIASSPTDLQTVLDSITESAARVCDSTDAQLFRVHGDIVRMAAHYGSIPSVSPERPLSRGSMVSLAILDRVTFHVPDAQVLSEVEYPETVRNIRASGTRTQLIVPLLRDDVALGSILIRRTEVRPFTDKQIALLETFADQAVIAIENTRLFEELESRNSDLAESLEQQTATSEVLRVIASSPADLQSVLDTVAENAARLCDASDVHIRRVIDDNLRTAAHYGSLQIAAVDLPIAGGSIPGRAVMERRTVHVPDVLAESEDEFSSTRQAAGIVGWRTHLVTPLIRQGVVIGTIGMRRRDVQPFSDSQIQLLETFADQAVIAIENARLFGELESRTSELAGSVEELQALGVVSQAVSSTLDLQHVLTTVLTHAVELSGMDGGSIFEFVEATGEFRDRATVGLGVGVVSGQLRETPLHIGEGMLGRAVQERQPVQVADIQAEGAYFSPIRETLIEAGYRAMLALPLLREDQVIGGLTVRRATPGEVPPKTVELLQTFASQSALAIQNARLFNEIEEKSRQLEEASQHKSQFLANMSHELRTPLNAILGYTELILDEIYGDVPVKIAATLERVQTSGKHLLGLINDVLDLSKMEAGQLILAPQEYALADVIQTVHTAVESLASEKGIGLRTEVAPDLPMGYGDDRRLVQVILNLVGNAIKFTDRGEVVIGCQVLAFGDQLSASDGPRFLVSVTDTGPGISSDQQARIFEEFQQADTSSTREKGGTGLGLSIAKRIVELHGGRIWVESQEGRGSMFAFEIPVRTGLADELASS